MEDHYQGLFAESLLWEILIAKNKEERGIIPVPHLRWERPEIPLWQGRRVSETPAVPTASPFMGAVSSLPSVGVTEQGVEPSEAEVGHWESGPLPRWARVVTATLLVLYLCTALRLTGALGSCQHIQPILPLDPHSRVHLTDGETEARWYLICPSHTASGQDRTVAPAVQASFHAENPLEQS